MKEFICTACENNCSVSMLAMKEAENPTHSVTTTVRTVFPRIPVLPVRTNRSVPKEKVMEIIRELSKVVITEKIGIGEIVAANILGTGSDIIVASDVLMKIL